MLPAKFGFVKLLVRGNCTIFQKSMMRPALFHGTAISPIYTVPIDVCRNGNLWAKRRFCMPVDDIPLGRSVAAISEGEDEPHLPDERQSGRGSVDGPDGAS